MVKEDRSGWVAVNPEFSNAKDDLPQVKPASTAYQIFQRQNTQLITSRLSSRGEPSDLAALTKATSASWQALPPDDKYEYEEEGAKVDTFQLESMRNCKDEDEDKLLYDHDHISSSMDIINTLHMLEEKLEVIKEKARESIHEVQPLLN